MSTLRDQTSAVSTMLVLLLSAGAMAAQTAATSSILPATAPTQVRQANPPAPIAATASPRETAGAASRPGRVSCTGGQLEIRAENSSLNQILRSVARCTGMKLTGSVPEQRVFGNYGPAAPSTVLATLLDGTGSNMLLRETAADQPAELILTPRIGQPTPPSAASYRQADQRPDQQADDSDDEENGSPRNPFRQPGQSPLMRSGAPPRGNVPVQGSNQGSDQGGMQPGSQTPVPQAQTGSAVTGPQPIPIGVNNVNGSPNNRSPTATTYPTTNSVSIDQLPTPSTTPNANGIVDAPNPPPAGSDTAAALNGAPAGTPGTTNISPDATSQTSTPGASNTTVPANSQQQTPGQTQQDLTPEQIFQQLQQRMQQQQQQQQQQENNPQ